MSTNLIGLGFSVLRVVFLVCLCLCALLSLLGLLVLLLVVHGLFFLKWQRSRQDVHTGSPALERRPAINSGQGWRSLTFAAFLAFGSALGGTGFCEKGKKRGTFKVQFSVFFIF